MVERVNHPAFPQPADTNAKIWRYLPRYKFDWLVTEGRLFMPDAAHLGDPLEGTQPAGDTSYWQMLMDHATSVEHRRTIEHNHNLIARFAAAFRRGYYVSCWNLSEALNPAMWAQYAEGLESVAIQTTVAKLAAALPAYVNIGIVRYIDYATERLPTLNLLEYITHKNRLFERECELRAVAMHPIVQGLDQEHFRAHHFQSETTAEFQVFAPAVELSALVEAVYIHPSAPGVFVEHVCSLCLQHGLPAPKRASW